MTDRWEAFWRWYKYSRSPWSYLVDLVSWLIILGGLALVVVAVGFFFELGRSLIQ